MNTNLTEFAGFQESLRPCAFDESSLSIGRVNAYMLHQTLLARSMIPLTITCELRMILLKF